MPLGDAVKLYQDRLAKDQAEVVFYGVVNGLRNVKDEPQARALLQHLASTSPYPDPARSAREILEQS
jgi:hypothetical protein